MGSATCLVLLLVTALLAGCSAGSTAAVARGPDAVAIGFTAEPANLDFTRTDGAAIPQALLLNVYEGLVRLDGDGAIVPLLAESWTVDDTRQVYEFRLRPGVRFSNGAPFTAEDVRFSLERVRTDWTVSLRSVMDVVDRVEVPDPLTARVVLSRPSNGWLYAMTGRVGAMFSPTGVADLATTAVGTGPYVVAERRRGDRIVLARRDDHWGPPPAYATVVLTYIRDPTALNNALLSGSIDAVATIAAPDSVPQFLADGRFRVSEGTSTSEVVLAINGARPPLDDVAVRRALVQAVDRRALLDVVWDGRGTPIGSMHVPTDPWFTDLTDVLPHDPQAARTALDRAARDRGAPLPELVLRPANLPYAVTAAQVVASQLAQVGVAVRIEPLDFPAVWLQQVFTDHDYDLSIVAHVEARDIATFAEPDYYWGYDEPAVAELLARADTGDEAGQVADTAAAARRLAEDAAAGFLFALPSIVVSRTEVTGLPVDAVGEAFDLTALGRG